MADVAAASSEAAGAEKRAVCESLAASKLAWKETPRFLKLLPSSETTHLATESFATLNENKQALNWVITGDSKEEPNQALSRE